MEGLENAQVSGLECTAHAAVGLTPARFVQDSLRKLNPAQDAGMTDR